MPRRLLAPALVLASAATPLSAGVVTVAPAGADHTQIAAALQHAAAGDVLIVRTGTYQSFALDGTAVEIVADEGAVVTVLGGASVRNLPGGAPAVLSGLRIAGPLAIEDAAAGVRVLDTSVWVGAGPAGPTAAAVRVERSGDVAFSRCMLQGAPGTHATVPAGVALRISASRVALHECTLSGGFGFPGSAAGSAGGAGGSAAALVSGELFASATAFHGGAGGAGGLVSTGLGGCASYAPLPGGSGGTGLVVDASAVARAIAGSVIGGAGGAGGTNACGYSNVAGAPGAAAIGTLAHVPGTARELSAPAVARETSVATLRVRGEPGERAFLFLAAGTGHVFSPALGGAVLIQNPFLRRVFAGVLPGSGEIALDLAVPELGAGVASRTLHVQALCVDGGGAARLAGARTLVLLDRGL